MAGMGIRVTPEQLQQVSARLDAGAAGIEGTLRELAANVARSGRTGPASPRPASSASGTNGSAVIRVCHRDRSPNVVAMPLLVASGTPRARRGPLQVLARAAQRPRRPEGACRPIGAHSAPP
jgi:hypothetical protein